MTRTCARPGCRESAVATLSYAYGDRAVWVEELAEQAHPMTHDMCTAHARDIRVPNGWTCRDLRAGTAVDAPVAPTESDDATSDGRLFADRIPA